MLHLQLLDVDADVAQRPGANALRHVHTAQLRIRKNNDNHPYVVVILNYSEYSFYQTLHSC